MADYNSIYRKKLTEKQKLLSGSGLSVLALSVSACGSSSNDAKSTTINLSKLSDGTYSESSSATGLTLKSSASASYKVADSSNNKYAIKLTADGEGTLEFDFSEGDKNDVIELTSDSKVTGFTTLKVVEGTLDVTALNSLGSITKIAVDSGVKITFAQLKESITEIESVSGDAAVEITVKSAQEATDLTSLVTAGTLKLAGVDTSALAVTAASDATETIDAATLTSTVDTLKTNVTTVTTTTTTTTDDSSGSPVNISLAGGVVEVGGTITGNITITWDGTAGASRALISQGGIAGDVLPDFSTSKANSIKLGSGQKIVDVAADLHNTLVTGAGTVETSASDGAQTIKVQTTGANTIKTGAGDDTIDMGNAELLTADDVIDGGDDTDTVKITANGDSNGAVFNQYNSNVEKIVIEANSTATTHAKLTLNNATAETDALEIDATALTDSSAKFTLALAGTTGNVDGALTVKGGADGDSITTGDGADTVTAGAGADTVSTGAGDDTINSLEVASVSDAVDGGAGTDKLVFVTSSVDADSKAINVSLDSTASDQVVHAASGLLFGGNQTKIENFDFSALTISNGATNAVVFSGLTTTTDDTTTVLTGSALTTDIVSDIANNVDMSGITNTKIEVLHLADSGAAVTIDAANLTDVLQITGGDGSDSLKLGEAAAFDMSAVTSFAALETILMNVTDKVATSLTINQTGSNDFGGTLTGKDGTAQVLNLADSGDTTIDITGITNTYIETINLANDDDDLTIDADNTANVTAINGVAEGNAENLILSGASTFDLSAITITNMTVKGTSSEAQTIKSSIGATTIDLVANGAADIIEYKSTTVGDTVTKFSGGTDKIKYDSAATEAAVVNDKQIAVVADLETDVVADASQNIDGGSDTFDLAAAGFIIVGTNAADSTIALYAYDGSASEAQTVTELLAAGDAVLVANLGLIDAAIAEDDINVF